MAAATSSAPVPLFEEGKQYWQDLVSECKRYVECINATLLKNGSDPDGLLQCDPATESLQITKAGYRSTRVKLTLEFRSWGPVIGATVYRPQKDGKGSPRQEFELPIARDLDGQIVAIYDEGRSFSPHEVASYLKQCFHNCYPGITLPC